MVVVIAGIFIAFSFFYYLEQKRKIKSEPQKDRVHKKFQQLLQQLEHREKLTRSKKCRRSANLQKPVKAPQPFHSLTSCSPKVGNPKCFMR